MRAVMNRGRWLVLSLTALTVVASVWLYNFYFSSTDAAIRHAEAFRFRRMTSAGLAEQGVYRFFYATNRKADPAQEHSEELFGNERESLLKFGSFDADIQPSLGLGMLINPTQWLQNEEIQLQNIRSLAPQEFTEQLRQQVEQSPARGLLVVLHGFREAHESALRKTAFLGHVLDINAPALVFDWPGDQGSSLRGYRRAHETATASGAELAETLTLLVNEIKPERLWIIANSMGGQVVVAALDKLYRQGDFADGAKAIEHVILTAPDVSREAFDNEFRDQILALTKHLTVYVSSNDRALLVSRLVNGEARGGESTLSPNQFAEASQIYALMKPGDQLVDLVDVTPVNRTRNFHNFSLETPEFFDDLFLRLANDGRPDSRLLYQVKTAEGRIYSVLTRGR